MGALPWRTAPRRILARSKENAYEVATPPDRRHRRARHRRGSRPAVRRSLAATAAPVICEQYGTAPVQGGKYIVQNNRWGASTAQCIDVSNAGFTVTRADHNNATNGPPASYPSIYAGCHYGACTPGSGLPARVNTLNNPVPRSTSARPTPVSGTPRSTCGSTRARTRRGRTTAPRS
ncbi:hypothetical protein ACFQZ4_08860 [Catellatospora coxensis]